MSGENRNSATDWIKKQMIDDYGKTWSKMSMEQQLDAIASFMTGYMQLRSKKADFVMIAKLREGNKLFNKSNNS